MKSPTLLALSRPQSAAMPVPIACLQYSVSVAMQGEFTPGKRVPQFCSGFVFAFAQTDKMSSAALIDSGCTVQLGSR